MEFIAFAIVIFAINLISFALFSWDKYRARHGKWRVRESTLLLSAALGGTIGIRLAQKYLRHKTHKQPFSSYINWIIRLQILLLVAAVIYLTAPFSAFTWKCYEVLKGTIP